MFQDFMKCVPMCSVQTKALEKKVDSMDYDYFVKTIVKEATALLSVHNVINDMELEAGQKKPKERRRFLSPMTTGGGFRSHGRCSCYYSANDNSMLKIKLETVKISNCKEELKKEFS